MVFDSSPVDSYKLSTDTVYIIYVPLLLLNEETVAIAVIVIVPGSNGREDRLSRLGHKIML